MFGKIARRDGAHPPPLSESQSFLAAQGLDGTLPQRLLRRPEGRPYLPVQIALPSKGATTQPTVLQELTLLGLRKPAGGWEAILEANATAATQEALEALEQRVSEGAIPARRFLLEVSRESERVRQTLQARLAELETRSREVEAELTRWQDEQAQGRGLLDGLAAMVQAVVGGRLSQSEAVARWNERETLAATTDAHRAALRVLAPFVEAATTLARVLAQVLDEATGAAQQAAAEAARLAQGARGSRTYGYQVSPTALARALAPADDTRALATLVTALREAGSAALLARARALAEAEAERQMAPLDIVALIALEGDQVAASEGAGQGADAVLVVGEELLDQVRRRPTWRLTPGARRRVETLQIVPEGTAVFDHPGLGTATYPDRCDRLAFLQVELEVALDELLLAQDGLAPFRAALAQREFFCLEEVAAAWRSDGSGGAEAGPPRTTLTDGDAMAAVATPNGAGPGMVVGLDRLEP